MTPPAGSRTTSPPTSSVSSDAGLSSTRVLIGDLFHDPLSASVSQFLSEFARAVRGARLYADNNTAYRGLLSAAARRLDELLLQRAELRFAVDNERIVFGSDEVHADADPVQGLPGVLFRSGLRVVLFRRGITHEDLAHLIQAIGGEYSRAQLTGEDLVSVLWRLDAPHFGYIAARLFTKVRASRDREHPAASPEAIIAALSAEAPRVEEVRGYLAGAPGEIIAFEHWSGTSIEELELLKTAQMLNQAATHPLELEELLLELTRQDSSVELTIRLFDRLLAAVSTAHASLENGAAPAFLVLYDALIEAGHFASLASLVARFASYDDEAGRRSAPERAALVRQLLRDMNAPERVRKIYSALNGAHTAEEGDGPRTSSALALVCALARCDAAPLFDALDALTRSPARRAVIAQLAREAPPTAQGVLRYLGAARSGPLVCDLLTLVPLLLPSEGLPIVLRAMRHPEAVVRADALRLALLYEDQQLDAVVAARLPDSNRAVRMAALAFARQRRGTAMAAALDQIMAQDDFASRDGEELRAWCSTITAQLSYRAVPALSRLLRPNLLNRLALSEEAMLAAIEALGTIDHPAARTQLEKELRALNKNVRSAAKRALERSGLAGFRTSAEAEAGEAAQPAAPPPMRASEAPTPEALGREVRGVMASLFGDS
jgi:hypothetical protein